jgi:hypothetical protein
VNRLQSTRQVIGIELAPDLFTNDAWEMVGIVQSLIATKLDGILITHDGVYDAKLRLSQAAPSTRLGPLRSLTLVIHLLVRLAASTKLSTDVLALFGRGRCAKVLGDETL